MTQSPPPHCRPTAAEALALLAEGNRRFASDWSQHPHSGVARRRATAREGQRPYAAILACSDSRCPVELVFDAGVGDLFVVRSAGNVAGPVEAASLEYAAAHLHAPLLAVLGHSLCGALTAAVSGAAMPGNLEVLEQLLAPAVELAREAAGEVSDAELTAAAVETNVALTLDRLRDQSRTLKSLEEQDKLRIIGGVYDLESGLVRWLE